MSLYHGNPKHFLNEVNKTPAKTWIFYWKKNQPLICTWLFLAKVYESLCKSSKEPQVADPCARQTQRWSLNRKKIYFFSPGNWDVHSSLQNSSNLGQIGWRIPLNIDFHVLALILRWILPRRLTGPSQHRKMRWSKPCICNSGWMAGVVNQMKASDLFHPLTGFYCWVAWCCHHHHHY